MFRTYFKNSLKFLYGFLNCFSKHFHKIFCKFYDRNFCKKCFRKFLVTLFQSDPLKTASGTAPTIPSGVFSQIPSDIALCFRNSPEDCLEKFLPEFLYRFHQGLLPSNIPSKYFQQYCLQIFPTEIHPNVFFLPDFIPGFSQEFLL